jgi:hypothetical protein
MAVRSHILNVEPVRLAPEEAVLGVVLEALPEAREELGQRREVWRDDLRVVASPGVVRLSSSPTRKPVLKWTGVGSSKRSLDCHATLGCGGAGGGGGGGAGGVAIATVTV